MKSGNVLVSDDWERKECIIRENSSNEPRVDRVLMFFFSLTRYKHVALHALFPLWQHKRWNFAPISQSAGCLSSINRSLIFKFIHSPSGKQRFAFAVEVYRAISGGRTDVPKDYSTFQTQRNFEKKELKTSNTKVKYSV